MTDESTAGHDARTATDVLPVKKTDAAVLGRGEIHIPDEDAVLLTDGGELLPDSLIDALKTSNCHPDVIRYAEKAADRGSTPILDSLRYFHRESKVSRIAIIGTQIEHTLWNRGADAVLAQHGHVDETSTVILEEIVSERAIIDEGVNNTDDMAYWRRNLEAALSSMEPETAVTERHNADDLVITPVGGSTREERAELIHAIERRGFEITSSSEEEYIYVDVTDDRLDHPFADEDADLLTDGGVDTANNLQHDPRGFDFTITPAVVVEVSKDDVVSKLSFADVQLRECGALHWTEWTGAEGLIPEWRWSEVRYLDTERVDRDDINHMARIAPCDWNLLSDAVQELVDQDEDEMDSADPKDMFIDGGER